MAGRTPNWNLNAMLKEDNTSFKGKVGAAWNNDDGTISIVLNPFVRLNSLDNIALKLFPNDRGTEANKNEFAPAPKKSSKDKKEPF